MHGQSKIKDTMRINLKEIGNIHARHGNNLAALSHWEKAYDISDNEEEKRQTCVQILRASFICENRFFLDRFIDKAKRLRSDTQPQF